MTTSRETLIAAYRAAHYVCGRGANAFVLRIGVPSPPLASLCRGQCVQRRLPHRLQPRQ